MLEGTVVGLFGIRGEAAAGQLPVFQMMLDALAADAVSRTSSIGAGAFLGILFFPAFHQCADSSW